MPHKANSTSFSAAAPRPGPGRPKLPPDPAGSFDVKAIYARLTPIALAECERILLSERRSAAMDGLKVKITEMLLDRQYGRPSQAITGPGGGPLLHSFSALMASIDGTKHENFGDLPTTP